jgi:hypothetical protein
VASRSPRPSSISPSPCTHKTAQHRPRSCASSATSSQVSTSPRSRRRSPGRAKFLLGWRRWPRTGGTEFSKRQCRRRTTQIGGESGRAPRTGSAPLRRRSGKAGNKLLMEEEGGRHETSDGIDTHLAATVLELYSSTKIYSRRQALPGAFAHLGMQCRFRRQPSFLCHDHVFIPHLHFCAFTYCLSTCHIHPTLSASCNLALFITRRDKLSSSTQSQLQ